MANLNKQNPETTATVSVVGGVGLAPTTVPWQSGDTVKSILDRAHIQLSEDVAVTLGRKRIITPETTTVEPNDTLVIAGKLSNG